MKTVIAIARDRPIQAIEASGQNPMSVALEKWGEVSVGSKSLQIGNAVYNFSGPIPLDWSVDGLTVSAPLKKSFRAL